MPARRSERIAARGDANGSPTNESNTGPVGRVRRGTNSRDQSDRPRGGRAAPGAGELLFVLKFVFRHR